ncbi:transport system permease protein [[Leptolyngbya] sp. PCC 7376]|uniref:FecCD family ABC transporter permease n=1 Tax=[Leptolyngbya] sp. PCC 7376 TaxID=111781 RepID=UPI00029F237B|nr:iron ABC transporter permease [[Leptolyngbya] sp. PCC 7376]AFY40084.1 transport system permease protein [[Leptolyngbya] sp. PCC 7376]
MSTAPSARSQRAQSGILAVGIVIGLVVLIVCFAASVAFGVADITPLEIYQALVSPDGSTEHLIIRTVRLPRSITALLVGAAVAVAGAIMQGLTRNPLADPGILGINAGAALAVVGSVFLLDASSLSAYAGSALVGATISTITVYSLGSLGRGGLTPLNLTIAGAAFTALISSLTTAILILSQRTLDEIRFWLAGSVAGRDLELVVQVLPYLSVGLLLGLALGKQLTTLSLGDSVAKGLGQNTAWVKVLAAISVVLLAGGSVAIAGPIGFVGLIVPHFVRFWAGADYRWILPYSALLGAIVILIADIIARLVIQPQELPVGLVMPLIGAPFFIYLIRSQVKR